MSDIVICSNIFYHSFGSYKFCHSNLGYLFIFNTVLLKWKVVRIVTYCRSWNCHIYQEKEKSSTHFLLSSDPSLLEVMYTLVCRQCQCSTIISIVGVVGLDVIILFMLCMYFILSAHLFHVQIHNKIPECNCGTTHFLCKSTNVNC
jgi:hypothetical protein